MSDSVQPHRWQPTRLPHTWDSPGKNTGVDCHFLLPCMKVKSESEVAQSCPTLSNPMDCSHQVPPSMGFSRQVYWSGVPLPSPPYDYYSIIYSIQDMEIIWVHWWMKGKENMVYLVLMCFIVSYFTDIFVSLFNKVKHCGNPVLSKSFGIIFQ